MNAWVTFWLIVLVVSLALYAVLVCTVTVGGFIDVIAMFRTVEKQHEDAAKTGKPNREDES